MLVDLITIKKKKVKLREGVLMTEELSRLLIVELSQLLAQQLMEQLFWEVFAQALRQLLVQLTEYNASPSLLS